MRARSSASTLTLSGGSTSSATRQSVAMFVVSFRQGSVRYLCCRCFQIWYLHGLTSADCSADHEWRRPQPAQEVLQHEQLVRELAAIYEARMRGRGSDYISPADSGPLLLVIEGSAQGTPLMTRGKH